MRKTATNTLASSSFVAGLILGVYILTGISIDSVDLMGMVGQVIVKQFFPQHTTSLGLLLGILSIIGIIQTIFLIASGLKYGITGLVMTILCFIGGILIVFNTTIATVAIILIFTGYFIANIIIPSQDD
jgi:hypothetical protein